MKLTPGAKIIHLKLVLLASVVLLVMFSAMPIGLQQAFAVNGGDGNLYVSSRFTDEVLRYDRNTGDFIDAFVTDNSTLNGGLNEPNGLVFGPDGHLYVASRLTDEVKKYNGTSGEFMGNFVVDDGVGGMDEPVDLEFGPDGKLYVTSASTDEVWRYDGTTGASEGAFVSAGSGGLDEPRALTFGPDANLYVSSRGTNEVLRYNGTTGASMGTFVGNNSTLNGGLNVARGLEFGSDDNLYVTSWQTDDVKRYNGTSGEFMDNFVNPAGDGGLNAPWSLVFGGSDGNLYVISHLTNQVLRYDKADGDFIDAFVTGNSTLNGGLSAPFDLAFAPFTTPSTDFTFTKTANPSSASGSTAVTYTYQFSNPEGSTSDLTVSTPIDDKCSLVSFVGGDDNNDNKVNPGETWEWNCSTVVSETTTNTATTSAVSCVPGTNLCIIIDFITADATVTINQVVGGEILGIDVSALLVAGAFSNAYWMMPLVGAIVGSVIALVGLRRAIK